MLKRREEHSIFSLWQFSDETTLSWKLRKLNASTCALPGATKNRDQRELIATASWHPTAKLCRDLMPPRACRNFAIGNCHATFPRNIQVVHEEFLSHAIRFFSRLVDRQSRGAPSRVLCLLPPHRSTSWVMTKFLPCISTSDGFSSSISF